MNSYCRVYTVGSHSERFHVFSCLKSSLGSVWRNIEYRQIVKSFWLTIVNLMCDCVRLQPRWFGGDRLNYQLEFNNLDDYYSVTKFRIPERPWLVHSPQSLQLRTGPLSCSGTLSFRVWLSLLLVQFENSVCKDDVRKLRLRTTSNLIESYTVAKFEVRLLREIIQLPARSQGPGIRTHSSAVSETHTHGIYSVALAFLPGKPCLVVVRAKHLMYERAIVDETYLSGLDTRLTAIHNLIPN